MEFVKGMKYVTAEQYRYILAAQIILWMRDSDLLWCYVTCMYMYMISGKLSLDVELLSTDDTNCSLYSKISMEMSHTF